MRFLLVASLMVTALARTASAQPAPLKEEQRYLPYVHSSIDWHEQSSSFYGTVDQYPPKYAYSWAQGIKAENLQVIQDDGYNFVFTVDLTFTYLDLAAATDHFAKYPQYKNPKILPWPDFAVKSVSYGWGGAGRPEFAPGVTTREKLGTQRVRFNYFGETAQTVKANIAKRGYLYETAEVVYFMLNSQPYQTESGAIVDSYFTMEQKFQHSFKVEVEGVLNDSNL